MTRLGCAATLVAMLLVLFGTGVLWLRMTRDVRARKLTATCDQQHGVYGWSLDCRQPDLLLGCACRPAAHGSAL